ncbi:MAG: sugar kinase [Actinomycetia bacterium]|nr:sugar kinase [Actinomycetes bacterium]
MSVHTIAIGECMLELTHSSDTELQLSVAGDTFNTAVHLRRQLGERDTVTYFTALGDSWYADFVRQRITAESVTPALVPGPGTPGAYFIRTDDAGERSFAYYRSASAAQHMLRGSGARLLEAACSGVDLVHISAITLQILDQPSRETLARILARVRSAQVRVSLDTNYRPSGWTDADSARATIDEFAGLADIVLPSLDDERALRGATDAVGVARHYRDQGADEVVVKDSTDPATVSWASHQAIIPVASYRTAVDTTGAGDAFAAGYLAGRLHDADPPASVRLGQRVAADVVMHPGAIAGATRSVAAPQR